ncbi:MAG: hypothetical protein Q4G26_02595 [Paracoccus sp. (in: a-proteobacteria)]|nr:hypothetical protein [Paracoccus sp. (in: a-proteobacteria)]
MEVSSEYRPARLDPGALHIWARGAIERGDLMKIISEIERHKDKDVAHITFNFDSPGGSLPEGLLIGKMISALSAHTTSRVASMTRDDAECASACVFAFAGAQHRFVSSDEELGVHKFYFDENADISWERAVSISQSMSAEIAQFISSRGITADFLQDVVSAEGDDIYWISQGRAVKTGLATQGVAGEDVKYVNIDGSLALRIEQRSYYGRNIVTLSCYSTGLAGVAFLDEPSQVHIGDAGIVSGGIDYYFRDARPVSSENYRTTIAFKIEPEMHNALSSNSSIGFRIYSPGGLFYGFQDEVEHPLIKEMASSCTPPQPVAAPMVRGHDFDLLGGDIDSAGVRNISLDECEEICVSDDSCLSYSYVVDLKWCWPKDKMSTPMPKPGVISAFKK